MHIREFDLSALQVGTRTSLSLDVTDIRHPSARLDVTIIRGSTPGKTVFALGGVHGDEYEGPIALWKLADQLNPQDLSGTVIVLPVANWKAFEAEQRCTPEDGANLNRCFPGDPRGTYSEVLASEIFEHFVRPSDMVIDLHSGGAAYSFYPTICYVRNSIAGVGCLEACRSFGLQVIWSLPDRTGVMTNEAARAGKIAIGAEYGGEARLDPAGADSYINGVIRSLQFMGVLSGCAPPDITLPIVDGDFLTTDMEFGLFHPTVAQGERVRAGQLLGTVTGFRGESDEQCISSRDGFILALRKRPVVHRGDWTINPVWICASSDPQS